MIIIMTNHIFQETTNGKMKSYVLRCPLLKRKWALKLPQSRRPPWSRQSAEEQNSHSVEIQGFFYLTDFTWKQFWLSTSRNVHFDNFKASFKNRNWRNRRKLISRKIRGGRKSPKFPHCAKSKIQKRPCWNWWLFGLALFFRREETGAILEQERHHCKVNFFFWRKFTLGHNQTTVYVHK